MTCPKCNQQFEVLAPEEGLPDNFTCDCPGCMALLLYDKGELTDFHKTIHQQNPLWPEDGIGTEFIEIQENS